MGKRIELELVYRPSAKSKGKKMGQPTANQVSPEVLQLIETAKGAQFDQAPQELQIAARSLPKPSKRSRKDYMRDYMRKRRGSKVSNKDG